MRFEQVDYESLRQIANRVYRQLKQNEIILFDGDLGAGKTTFIQMLLDQMGYSKGYSPTYSLHNHYHIKNIEVHHFDLYRIENLQELETISFFETLELPNLVFIEWASKIQVQDFPMNKKIVRIEIGKYQDQEAELFRWVEIWGVDFEAL